MGRYSMVETKTAEHKKIERAVKIIEHAFNKIRKESYDMAKDCGYEYVDPLADVRLWLGGTEMHGSVIRVTYDGAGYEYFSDDGDFIRGRYKHEIDAKLRKIGFRVEDFNTWSFGVYQGA